MWRLDDLPVQPPPISTFYCLWQEIAANRRNGVTIQENNICGQNLLRKRELKEAGILNFCCENKPTYARLKKKEEINRPKKFTRFSNFAYSGDREISTIR